ncbi:hypothetical protein AGLY_008503 [Aphis glycines]|uniref:Uncharacterized protein n=1 Tax=Aphis glycines TaxID=307491 RepID=A0A6G0TMG4_APHGL|nr:hypothetical protein AGLY_008503 [Aphis glycines]
MYVRAYVVIRYTAAAVTTTTDGRRSGWLEEWHYKRWKKGQYDYREKKKIYALESLCVCVCVYAHPSCVMHTRGILCFMLCAVRACCCYTGVRACACAARTTRACVCVYAVCGARARVWCVCVLAHELFARGPTDFEITPSDWPGPAVYIKSANGGRATGRVPRGPPVHRAAYIQQYCRPTDIHTSICQVFIYALFFFFFPNFSRFSTSTTVQLRSATVQRILSLTLCLPVASIWRQFRRLIVVVRYSFRLRDTVVFARFRHDNYTLLLNSATTAAAVATTTTASGAFSDYDLCVCVVRTPRTTLKRHCKSYDSESTGRSQLDLGVLSEVEIKIYIISADVNCSPTINWLKK